MQALILRSAVLIFSSFVFVDLVASAPLVPQQVKKDSTVKPPPAPSQPTVELNPPAKINGKDVFLFVELHPEFPGGDAALNKYLANNVRYPQAALQHNITGTVFVSFIVTDEGELVDIKTVGKPLGGGLEEEAKRVVNAMPKWVPGKQSGTRLNVQFNLPVHFVVQDSSAQKKKMADDSTYLIVDEMPTYPGGQPAMMKFLSKNVKYPRYAVEKGISGTVYVKFDISADGSISNVESVNKTVGVLEEEAIRVVKKMPKWNPGKEKGEAVRVKYTLPVSFTMSIR